MAKNVWITGASSGIGKALAIKFSSKGWNVAVSARRKELLDELVKGNSNISSFPLDVTNHESCIQIFKNILEKYSNIDLCIFSTGTAKSNFSHGGSLYGFCFGFELIKDFVAGEIKLIHLSMLSLI